METNETEAPEQNVAAVKTAEEWARLRGHFPEFTPGVKPKGFPKAVVPPVHNPNYRLYTEAKFLLWGGVTGKEMTLSDYDEALKTVATHVFR